MPQGRIDYGRLVEEALRTVVRDVLGRLAEGNVPSPHHFFITFRTTDPGVELADFLHERYPNEMTIVLQYQYWDLEVDEEGFAVTLSFNDLPQRLRIPYAAIKVFADPGAEFGLQFTLDSDNQVVPMLGKEETAAAVEHLEEGQEAEKETPAEGKGSAEIVALDRFRKK